MELNASLFLGLHLSKNYANLNNILCGELVCAHWDTIDKLHGAPEPVELHALVHVHDSIARWRSAPHTVLQKAADAREDDLKH